MTSSPAAGTEPDRILRECDCPPWVLYCSHFGDDMVIMTGPSPFCAVCGEGGDTDEYLVVEAYNRFRCEACGNRMVPGKYMFDDPPYWGLDYDAALAAFHEAEEKLLAGTL